METIKPAMWAYDPAFVAPEWRWFSQDLAFLFVYWNGQANDLLSNANPDTAELGNIVPETVEAGVGVNHSDSLDFTNFRPLQPGTGGVTMCSYFRRPVSGPNSLICQRIGNKNHQMELRCNTTAALNNNGAITWFCREVGDGHADTLDTALISGQYHIAHGVRNLGGAQKIYVDGVDLTETSISNSQDLSDATNDFALGGLPGSSAVIFREIKLLDAGWNRALSPSEIAQHAADPFGPITMFDDYAAWRSVVAAGGLPAGSLALSGAGI